MKLTTHQVFLSREDHDQIYWLIRNSNLRNADDRHSAGQLKEELKKAILLDTHELPPDVVRLGTLVKVKELESGKTMQLKIVTPDKADRKTQQISVLSPVGTALIGLKTGSRISWQVPAGTKTFLIEEVMH